jgi:iron(III) transport system permease protein
VLDGLRRRFRPLALAAWGPAALVALPVVAVATSLFAPPSPALGHIAETVLPGILFNTLVLMAGVALGAGSMGVACAWLVTMCRFPGSRALEWLLLLPLAMPAYIIGYAYTDVLAFAGPVQTGLRDLFGWSRSDYWFPDIHSVWGAAGMLSLVLYPYVYVLARAAFLEQSLCMMEAARALGRGPWESFRRVALPVARPAIAAGLALALMETLADFATVQYFGVDTFTTAVYRTWFGMGDRIGASQLATALLAGAFLLIALERASRRARRFHGSTRRQRLGEPAPLAGIRALAAFAACAVPLVLGFVLPVIILARLHLTGGDPFFGPRFVSLALNSFAVAAVAACVIVAVALLIAYAGRMLPGLATQAAIRFAAMGYAIPGTVIAVGVLAPLGLFDNGLDRLMRETLGVSTGLLFSGTLVALVFAYLVRFLAVALGSIEAGYGKIPRGLDDAARALGRSQGALVRLVHVPLLRRSTLTALIIVFVDVLKELPATLIVRPFGFDTLAVRVYQLASDERLSQASTAALAIVAVGLVPVILLTRSIGAGRDHS